MRGRSGRLALGIAAVLVVAFVFAVAPWRGPGERTKASPAPPAVAPPSLPAPVARPTAVPSPSAVPPAAAPRAAEPPATAPALEEAPAGDPLADLDDDAAAAWAAVDMDAVRRAMPDNIYWTMSAPSKDPAVLRAREEERDRWNVEYGKVLSNTATEEEIHAYYAHRERLSRDYVEFATHLLVNYGKKLPQRDVGLLKVAAEMNLARLEEIPRQIAEALERHKAHEAARQAWLAEQKAFEQDAR